ncbi:ecotin precursor [Paraburkholderia sp.]|uniref:ecotin precursor n=1 Tax=Paraburkholderia sp. TaxID=1926495 RepID=UPI003D6F6606
MKKIAAAVLMVASLTAAGQASAHGRGGDIVGALIGGAVLGAVVTSALNPGPVYAQPAYAQPVYAQPVYAQPVYQPVYQQAPQYAGPPPGYCYDRYQRAYVPCGAPAGQYGYEQQPGW